ncbi:unnamed protein product [Effrenium voratum]|nr:unnamed protein product [Effrenium voratum]
MQFAAWLQLRKESKKRGERNGAFLGPIHPESLDSELIEEVPPGQSLEVTEAGQGRRVKVKTVAGNEGWISTKTKLNEPLVMKRKREVEFAMEGWETKAQHEVKSMVTVRPGALALPAFFWPLQKAGPRRLWTATSSVS